MQKIWKDDWAETKQRFQDWWNGKGFLVGFWGGVPLAEPRIEVEPPPPAVSLEQQWADNGWRVAEIRHRMAGTAWPLDCLPLVHPYIGPGSLAMALGSPPEYQPDTVWFNQAESCDSIRFDANHPLWQLQMDLTDRLIADSNGNYFVGVPDLVENWDILGSLRGAENLLMDMIERPGWVKDRLDELNEAYFAAFEDCWRRVIAQDGSSMFGWFELWAPGRVAKVQCDGCAMFSPAMFREFVVPTLADQCKRLDYSMFHLDGSQCLDKLDALLEIESLTAIEWTPDPKVPSGGNLYWVEMYRRILSAGKRVQILGATAQEIEPMLDAIGADGVYFLSNAASEAEAEKFEKVVARLR